MLRRFHVGRFAHNRPPLGESRLLGFAQDDRQTQDVEISDGSAIFEGRTTVERMRADARRTMALNNPLVHIEGFDAVVASPELLQKVLDRSDIPTSTLRELWEERLGKNAVANFKDIDLKTLPSADRQFLLTQLLQKHPEITVQLAKTLDERIEGYNGMMRTIEHQLQTAFRRPFALPDLSGESVAQLQYLSDGLKKLPQEELVTYLNTLREKGDVSEEEIASEVAKMSVGRPVSDDERKNVVSFCVNLHHTYNKKARWAGSAWVDSAELDEDQMREKQRAYVLTLEAKKTALIDYADLQIRHEAEKIIEGNLRVRKGILDSIRGNADALAEEELDRRLLEQEGYGLSGLNDACARHINVLRDMFMEKQPDGTFKEIKKNHVRYLDHATKALAILALRKEGGNEDIRRHLEAEKREQEAVDEWACDIAIILRRLHGLPEEGMRRRAIETFLRESKLGTLTALHDRFEPNANRHDDPEEYRKMLKDYPDSRISNADFPHQKREALTTILLGLDHDPFALLEGLKEDRALEPRRAAFEAMDDATVWTAIEDTRGKLRTVFSVLEEHPIFKNHEIARTLDLSGMFQKKKTHIADMLLQNIDRKKMQDSDKKMLELPPGAKQSVPRAMWEVRQLEKTLDRLQKLKIEEIELNDDEPGYFRDGTIFINEKNDPNVKDVTRHHEEGHALLWALRESFPFLLVKHLDAQQEKKLGMTNESFEETLLNLRTDKQYAWVEEEKEKGTWHKNALIRLQKYVEDQPQEEDVQAEADQIYLENMMNELLARHAEWVHANRRSKEANPTELALFRALDEEAAPPEHRSTDALQKLKRDLEDAAEPIAKKNAEEETGTQRTRPGDDDDGGVEPAGAQETPTASRVNIHDDLREARREIEMMEAFLNAYPEAKEVLEKRIEDSWSTHKKLSQIFLTKKKDGMDITPEEDAQFLDDLRELRMSTREINEKLHVWDAERLDISQVPKTKKPGFFDNIHFISVLDVIKLCKDIGEDIQSIYKRRQDRALKDVGTAVTDALGYGKVLPYIGEYFEKMRGYHDRRYSGADVEAAKKWEESLKYIDSYTVTTMLGNTQNRDFVRGGISLLVSRGDMDWNDEGIWHTLERLSGYTMPVEACKRSDVLRDTWLRKMINEAWHDKEQYFSWRQGNDSAITKNKNDFNPTADQFANVAGGLSTELYKQLKLFYEWNNGGKQKGQPIPDDVKPHLYEQCLHYAMRAGKMKMEDKFFYLVQGVRHGILSIDRLRVLAGEGGEILLKFPFIDYFYQKNNSFREVERLGERLEEAGDRFKPGAKTMCFLQYELPKSEAFQQRLSKAMARDNIEKIDHEDFPMIVGQINFNTVDEMLGHLSGDRFKITKEAAKNSYVGFNTKFKAMARLADMEGEKLARFTQGDAMSMAMSVTSFIHFDNLITRKAWEGNKRQSLTWNDINYSTGPSTNGMPIKDFRNGAYGFIHDLLRQLEDEHIFDWNKIKRETGDDFSKENFLQEIGEKFVSKSTATKEQRAALDAIEHFQTELETAFNTRQGQDILKKTLKRHCDRETMPENYIMEESASKKEEYLKKEFVEDFFSELSREERQAAAA